MRIGSSQRASHAGGASGPARSGGGGERFAVGGGSGPSRTDQARSTQRVVSIGTVLALQTVEDAMSGRRRAVARGNQVLDLLERIKVELLSGPVSDGQKVRLEQALDSRDGDAPESDPDLRETLKEIDLRARVELAKLAFRNR